jgi:FAD/FMN-containing dehydrogenase
VLPVGHVAPRWSTIGGCLATNDHHIKRLHYGRVKDSVLGVDVLLADGRRACFGGSTIKNVSGYDVGSLFLGALGTLAVIVECSLRLRPAPLAEAALLVPMRSSKDAVDAALCTGGSPLAPAGLHVLSSLYMKAMPSLRALLGHAGRPWVLSLFEGHPRAVESQVSRALALSRDQSAGGAGLIVPEAGGQPRLVAGTSGRPTAAGPPAPADSPAALGGASQSGERGPLVELLPGYSHESLVEELGEVQLAAEGTFDCAAAFSVPVSAVGGLVSRLQEGPATEGVEVAYRVDCGVGTGEILVRGAGGAAFLRRIRAAAERDGGSVSLLWGWRALGGGFDAWGGPPETIDLARKIKGELDPRNTLSPGRYVGGI